MPVGPEMLPCAARPVMPFCSPSPSPPAPPSFLLIGSMRGLRIVASCSTPRTFALPPVYSNDDSVSSNRSVNSSIHDTTQRALGNQPRETSSEFDAPRSEGASFSCPARKYLSIRSATRQRNQNHESLSVGLTRHIGDDIEVTGEEVALGIR